MVDGHQHHAMLLGQAVTVITDIAAGAAGEAAAMAPDHHGTFPPVSEPCGPNVQTQAIFALGGAVKRHHFLFHEAGGVGLGRAVAEAGDLAHLAPRLRWFGWHETTRARSRRAIGNAFEDFDGAIRPTADL